MKRSIVAGFGRGFGFGYWNNKHYHYTKDLMIVSHTFCFMFWMIHILIKKSTIEGLGGEEDD